MRSGRFASIINKVTSSSKERPRTGDRDDLTFRPGRTGRRIGFIPRVAFCPVCGNVPLLWQLSQALRL
jgi:hypothetical protein